MISILALLTIAIPVADVLVTSQDTKKDSSYSELLRILPSPYPEGYMESSHLLQEAQDYNSFFIVDETVDL